MQLKVMNWILLACLATALTAESETRSRRHLYDMQQRIAYKLFTRNEPNCTRSQPGNPFQNPSFIRAGVVTPPPLINRIRKIPVQFPEPVLPEVSTILNPYDANYGDYYPVKVNQPDSSYSYLQKHRDNRLTTYTGLNSLYSNYDGPVVVKETENKPPSSLFFDNVPESGSYSKAPVVDIIGPKPVSVDMPAEHAIYEAPVLDNPGYSYRQIHGSGGMTTAHRVGAHSAPPINVFPNIPERNPFGPSASHFTPYSYNQDYSGMRVENYAGTHKLGVGEHDKDFSASEPHTFGTPFPSSNSVSYKQASSDSKVTSYNGAQINNQPAYITGRKKNVAAGLKVNGIHNSSLPLVNRFAFPTPNDFAQIPSVESSAPQKTNKPPSASGTSSFVYKYANRDGSVTRYGGDDSINNKVNQPDSSYSHQQIKEGLQDYTPKPTVQGNTRVFESPISTDPFNIDVNRNAFKPSSPVSGSFSYKLLNNGKVDYHYDIGRNEVFPGSNEPFSVSPLPPVSPAPVQSYVEHDSQYSRNPMYGQSSSLNQGVIPQSYSHIQTSYPYPRSNPFLTLNADKPATNYVNMKKNNSNQQQYYSDPFHNYNKDFYPDPKDYMYIPPTHYDEIPPPIKPLHFSRLPPKKFSNRFLYENFDGYNFRDFYLPTSTPKPQESLADNFYGKGTLEQFQKYRKSVVSNQDTEIYKLVVAPELVSTLKPANNIYAERTLAEIPFYFQPSLSIRNPMFNYPAAAPEQVSIPNSPVNSVHDEQIHIEIPSRPYSISNHQNSLFSNPTTVPAKTSCLFKQSNADGSSITTTNDGNTMSVQVEEAREPAAVQDEQSLGNMEETPRPVEEVPSTVPLRVVVEETERPEPEPSTEMPRRRKIKRIKVKQRGDIPDDE